MNMKKIRRSAGLLLVLLMCAAAFPAKAHALCSEHSLYQAEYSLPTCTEDGYYILRCHNCRYLRRVTTDKATGHSWENVHTEPATCTENAVEYFECSECREITDREIPNTATGHSFGAWTVLTPATCTNEGIKARECGCGYTERAAVPAKGHSFGAWTVLTPANCMDEGIKARECACGYTERAAIPTTDHAWDKGFVAAQPTTASEGFMLYVCTVCGMERTRSIPKLSADASAQETPSPTPSATEPAADGRKHTGDHPSKQAGGASAEPRKHGAEFDKEAKAETNGAAENSAVPAWAIGLTALSVASIAVATAVFVLARKRKKRTGE